MAASSRRGARQSAPSDPSAEHFNILPADAYTNASGAELQLFSMVQRDTELLGLFSELRRAEERSERKPVHGDVRLDQFLVAGKEIFLVDWEEFRIGDPARDVGAFLGEVIFRALLAVFMNEGLHDSVEDGAGLRSKILEVGAGEIESRSAFLGTFLEAYGAHHGVPGEEFRIRTVSYAGWHLLDRVIANARRSYHLPATMRGVAGIGRAALFAPTRYASSFGFKGEGA